MFRHKTAILRESPNTQDHKSSTPVQVLKALNVTVEVPK